MILMGSLANQWQDNKWEFVFGGAFAALLWFLSLAVVGKLFAKWLASAAFWRWFNRVNALLILGIAVKIATQPL